MKVIIAIDSLKGSLSSIEAGMAAKEGILLAKPKAKVVIKPMADGGEGTVDALIDGLDGKKKNVTVTGPMGMPVSCYYGYLKDSNTAVMEMAAAAGITLVQKEKRNPLIATTYGVGEMINDAIENGCRNFIIGIGGSATNDGGIGMLKALGFGFYDKNGNDVGEGGQALEKIENISVERRNPLLDECNFKVACDVTNPLYGENGATYIYGPQKGVTEKIKKSLDYGMKNFAIQTSKINHNDKAFVPGAGAAGGLGFAFVSYLNAELLPGVELILQAIRLEEELENTDIVITGEGRIDGQTAMGKAPIGVAKLAKKFGVKVIAFAGSVTNDVIACNEAGIDAIFPIIREVTTLEEAMNPRNAWGNMRASVEQVFRLL